MTAAIEAVGLGKTFRRKERRGRVRRAAVAVRAVAGVDLRVEHGEMIGYLGPNGAGKSTTLKMITGILQPTEGSLTVAGLSPVRDRPTLALRLGAVFGQRTSLWWDLPLADSFELLRHLYRVEPARYRRNLARLTELFELGALLPVAVRQLSLGQRMRGELAAALLHDPTLLVLDEPTIGLDVVSKHAVRGALRELHASGDVTIVLTTHDLADVEELCERVVVIDRGRVVADGALAELVARYGETRTLVVELERELPPIDLPGLRWRSSDGPRQWLTFARSEVSAADAIVRVAGALPVLDVAIEEPEIEDVLHRIYTQGVDPAP